MKIAKRRPVTNNCTQVSYQCHLFRMGVWCHHSPHNALIATICSSLTNSIPFVYSVLAAGNLLVVTIYQRPIYNLCYILFYCIADKLLLWTHWVSSISRSTPFTCVVWCMGTTHFISITMSPIFNLNLNLN